MTLVRMCFIFRRSLIRAIVWLFLLDDIDCQALRLLSEIKKFEAQVSATLLLGILIYDLYYVTMGTLAEIDLNKCCYCYLDDRDSN